MQFVIILLLAAILITLLGAWVIVAWIIAILIAAALIFIPLSIMGDSFAGWRLQKKSDNENRALTHKEKIKQLEEIIKRKKVNGYDTSEFEQELEQLNSHKD